MTGADDFVSDFHPAIFSAKKKGELVF